MFLAFSTNSDICRTVGFSFYIAKASGQPEALIQNRLLIT